MALKARLEVALEHTSAEDASQTVERLLSEHPGDSYLQVAKALLLIRGRDRAAATSELRIVAEQHRDDTYVHQVLAGLLGCYKVTWPEAWEHWKIALASGPLLTPSYSGAAYYLARRLEPKLAGSTLKGASPVERLALKTRALGFQYIFDGFLGFIALAALIGSKSLGAGVALGVITMACGLWCAYTNFYVGCWKCLTVWIFASVLVWPLFVWILNQPLAGFVFLLASFFALLFTFTRTRRITLPHERLSADLQRRSTK